MVGSVLKMATTPLLNGKVAVITGAAGKFGTEIAKRFVEHGAKAVILADKNKNDCLSLAALLNDKRTIIKAVTMDCDVTKTSDIDNAIAVAKKKYGRLDIFYNNAGVNTVSPMDYDVFEDTMNINVNSVLAIIDKAAGAMKGAGGGCILCTGSTMGLPGDMVPSAYSISKTAVMAVIQAKAAELASDHVRVNAISPAANVIDTSMLQKFFTKATTTQQLPDMIKKYMDNRLVNEDDVADAAVHLASDACKSVTGHNHVLKGMYTVV